MPKLTPFQRNGIDQLIADVLKKNKQHLKGPLSTWEAVEAFAAAVNWTEPFMLSILGFHFTYLLLAVFTRRIWWAQLILMFAALVIVHATEYANAYMVVHWQEYSTQNYFDEKGLFMSSVVSAPILVTNFYMLLYGLYNASSLLISVKANQLKKGKGKAGKTKEGGEKAEVTGKKANANLKAEKVD